MRQRKLRQKAGRLAAIAAVGLGVAAGSAFLATAAQADVNNPDGAVETAATPAEDTTPDDFGWD